MQERRRFVRVDVRVNIWWRKIPDSAVKGKATNKDISEQGIWLIVDEAVQTGDKLQLEMELPTNKIIKCVGEVVWVDPFMIVGYSEIKKYNVGIKFINITAEDRGKLQKFINSNLFRDK